MQSRSLLWVVAVGSLVVACSSKSSASSSSTSAPPSDAKPSASEKAVVAPAVVCADLEACSRSCAKCEGGACERTEARSCRQLGTLHQRGKIPQFDLKLAADAFRVACDSGDLASCVTLALQSQDGRGVPWDQANAAKLYKRACDGGIGVGCFNLALMYGEGNGLKQDHELSAQLMAQAEKLYLAECEGTEIEYCSNIGFLYEMGMVGEADPSRAVPVYRKACERGDHDSCASLSLLELEGNGIEKNRNAARARVESDCNAGGFLSCAVLGNDFDHSLDRVPARSVELIEKACLGGVSHACGTLSAYYGMAKIGPENQPRSEELARRACALGDPASCMLVAEMIRDHAPAEAKEFYLLNCHIGRPEGCVGAFNLVLRGLVPEGSETTQQLAERACALGRKDACILANGSVAPAKP